MRRLGAAPSTLGEANVHRSTTNRKWGRHKCKFCNCSRLRGRLGMNIAMPDSPSFAFGLASKRSISGGLGDWSPEGYPHKTARSQNIMTLRLNASSVDIVAWPWRRPTPKLSENACRESCPTSGETHVIQFRGKSMQRGVAASIDCTVFAYACLIQPRHAIRCDQQTLRTYGTGKRNRKGKKGRSR